MLSSRGVDPCARCGFANLAEARFCGECGEVLRGAKGPRTGDIKHEPETLRDPPRDSPEALARLDVQREFAAESAWRLASASRLLERIAAHAERSGRIGGVVNLAVARATAIGALRRAKEAGSTANEHFTAISRASEETAVRGLEGPSAVDATVDGLRPAQGAEDVALALAAHRPRFTELAQATTHALDAGQPDWDLGKAMATLRTLASKAEEGRLEAARIERERSVELDDLTAHRPNHG